MEREFEFFDDNENELDNSLEGEGERTLKVRLDKWLWAARFFKTRALARAAVEAGKVFYNGERSKPSREIELEALLQIRQGRFEKTVIVKGLSTRRRSTEEALQLFEETEASKAMREFNSEFQENAWSDPTYAHGPRSNFAPQDPQRRTTRFLRRSFNRQTQNQGRTEQSREEYPDYPQEHHQPHFPREQYSRNDYPTPYAHGQYPRSEHSRNDYPSNNYSKPERHRNDYPQNNYSHPYSRSDHSRNDYHHNYPREQTRNDYSHPYSRPQYSDHRQYPDQRSDYQRSDYPQSRHQRQDYYPSPYRHDHQKPHHRTDNNARASEYHRSDYSRNERFEPQYNPHRPQKMHYDTSKEISVPIILDEEEIENKNK